MGALTVDLTAVPVRLSGGQGRCWRVGDVVLKPADGLDPWRADVHRALLAGAPSTFTVPAPVDVGHKGWMGWAWCDGRPRVEPRFFDLIAAARDYHGALAVAVPARPAFLDDRDDPWAVGDRVAWEEIEATADVVPPSPQLPALRRLFAARRPLALESQLIHGDLPGNMLFPEDSDRPPAIIDLSPYWRPVGFALAIAAFDAMTWWSTPPEVALGPFPNDADFPQLLIRAAIYRIVTEAVVYRDDPRAAMRCLEENEPVVDLIVRIA